MNNVYKANIINGIVSNYININDRALQYGDGLFETILCHNNKLYYWPQHYLRLQRSAHRLNIICPEEAVLLDDIAVLLANQLVDTQQGMIYKMTCVIKIILSRGTEKRGYRYSNKIDHNRIVMLSKLDASYSSLLSGQLLSGNLFLCETQVSINESLAGLKHLNRLENVLANNEWINTTKQQYIDGLMLNARQHVIECTMSNIFAVKDKQLITPQLNQSGVAGIMRAVIIELAADIDLQIKVCNVEVKQLLTMDELFISNCLIGIKSIDNFCDTEYKKNTISGLILDKLLKTKKRHVNAIF